MPSIGFVYFKADMALLSYAHWHVNIIEKTNLITWENYQTWEICKETWIQLNKGYKIIYLFLLFIIKPFCLVTFINVALLPKQSHDATEIVCSADAVFKFRVFISQDLDDSITSNSIFCLASIT